MRKTKIICTLGPSTDNEETISSLMLGGMNVARINFSHGTFRHHKKRIDMIKKVRKKLDLSVALLLDTKGPEIRTGKIKNSGVFLEDNQKFILTTDNIIGNKNTCSITFKNLTKFIKIGTNILIDDGLIKLVCEKINKNNIVCKVINGGLLSSCKGVNIPEINLSLPFIGSKDALDIKFASEHGFDFVAASFTRSEKDVLFLRNELKKNGCQKLGVIAKIENLEGLNNIEKIIEVSDGVMIGRGDLGVETPIEKIPIIQKKLIKKTIKARKPVIVATQMLESMIKNSRPTRAECTDVANAIYDGTSAIMLSAETASGEYPVQSVDMMSRIAKCTEDEIDYKTKSKNTQNNEKLDTISALSHATCTVAHDIEAAAIIVAAKTSDITRLVSSFKPNCKIISVAYSESLFFQMSIFWGVIPIFLEKEMTNQELFKHISKISLKKGLLQEGDNVVIISNSLLESKKTVSFIKIHTVQNEA